MRRSTASVLRGSARTTPCVRAELQAPQKSSRALAVDSLLQKRMRPLDALVDLAVHIKPARLRDGEVACAKRDLDHRAAGDLKRSFGPRALDVADDQRDDVGIEFALID